MSLVHLYPKMDNGLCDCGCGQPLTGKKKRWASKECQERALDTYLLVKGDTQEIRRQVFARDNGICANCGQTNEAWHADHIVPVHKGGGYCDLDNFQTLCVPCHQIKSNQSACQISLYTSHDASMFARSSACAFGAGCTVPAKMSIENIRL